MQATGLSYATRSGSRLFVPIDPIDADAHTIKLPASRQDSIVMSGNSREEKLITITIPDGCTIESLPADKQLEQPFGIFHAKVSQTDSTHITITMVLTQRQGTYPPSLYPSLKSFVRAAGDFSRSKLVLKLQ